MRSTPEAKGIYLVFSLPLFHNGFDELRGFMRKSLFFVPLLAGLLMNGCSGARYLKPGETNTSGKLAQTIEHFTYKSTSDDNNSLIYELSYLLHSSNEKIIALEGFFSYSVQVDDSANRGGLTAYSLLFRSFPTSIAPNQYVRVILDISCLRDWEKLTVSYKDKGGTSYSFGLLRSDYQN